MYYELYVDVLFLVNFMMDYLLLLLVRRMLKCTATHLNVCIGALTGAGLTCVIIVLPIPYGWMKFILFYLLVNTCMIVVGLKIKQISSFVKAMILLYIGAFLMGGILGYVRQYIKIGSLFFGIAVLGYYVALGIWNFIVYLQKMHAYICKVELYMGGNVCHVTGLVDTGNSLKDPVTGKPVCILDRETAKEFFDAGNVGKLRYIPYHSIGKADGVLMAVQIDRMHVQGKDGGWILEPLIAISEEQISGTGEYQMILNPNLF